MSEKQETVIFVPKPESDSEVALGIDEAIASIVKIQKEKSALDKTIKNLKAVVKTHLKAKGVTEYETPTGSKAAWSSRQSPSYDKDAILELTGEDFALCVSYKTVKTFKVT
jgi:hypothetical protein